MRFYLILLFSFTVILSSCKKDKDSDPASIHDIYIGGGDNRGPVYWKNGERVSLPYDTSGSAASYVSCMFVDGNDVYAAGRHVMQAAYWKNGILELLPVVGSGYSYATGIMVLNGEVYISGVDNFVINSYNSHAIYWKNSIRFELLDTSGSYTTDIHVSGNDVYVTGGDNTMRAVCWKNGVPTTVCMQSDVASAIAFNDQDQYILVDSASYPVYWKNGIKYDLPNAPQYSRSYDIFSEGNDLYFCGWSDNDYPFLWQNGNNTSLPIDPNMIQGYAYEISRLNNDVYVVGLERDGYTPTISRALYWKNGERYVLPSVSGSAANCIFIH